MITIYTDGACKGNPGKAGCGLVFYDKDDVEVFSAYKYIGISTNNIAEYTAIKLALTQAIKRKETEIILYSDSNLAVQQLNGKWKVKNKNIIPLYNEIKELIKFFDKITIKHVKAHCGITGNERADQLANMSFKPNP